MGTGSELVTLYAAAIAAHVALLGIALPVALSVLVAPAQRYSTRPLVRVLSDWYLLGAILLMVAAVGPALLGVRLVLSRDSMYLLPEAVGVGFVAALVGLGAAMARAASLVQPAELVRRSIRGATEADWLGTALSRYGKSDTDTPSQELMTIYLRLALHRPIDQFPSEERSRLEAEIQRLKKQSESDHLSVIRARERLLEAHKAREDALSAATSLAMQAVSERDAWTLIHYCEALRTRTLQLIRRDRTIGPFAPAECGEALAKLVLRDHLSPLFELAIRTDSRCVRLLIECLQEWAIEMLDRPSISSLAVATLDSWSGEAKRSRAPVSVFSRLARIYGLIGAAALERAPDHIEHNLPNPMVHAIQSLAHLTEIAIEETWAPQILADYRGPDVQLTDDLYTFPVEVHEAFSRMHAVFERREKPAQIAWATGVGAVAQLVGREAHKHEPSAAGNDRMWRLWNELATEARRCIDIGKQEFAAVPLVELGDLLRQNSDAARTNPIKASVSDPYQVRAIQEQLFLIGSRAETKAAADAAQYAFRQLADVDPPASRIRGLFTDAVGDALGNADMTIDGVIAFVRRFCVAANSHLGLKPCGATEAEASAAHRTDPDTW